MAERAPVTEADDVEFEVMVGRAGGTAIVRVAGALDLATVPTLEGVLKRLEDPCERVVLDLSELTFIDSTGLTLAVMQHRRAMSDGFDFVLAGARGPVLRTLRLAGLDVALPIAPDVQAALADGTGGASEPGRSSGT
jgi:anti-sigma B factor antagonist